jgi:hypothetical protein
LRLVAPSSKFLQGIVERTWPNLENISFELKTVLPNADFVIEGYVDPAEPWRDEGLFIDHIGWALARQPWAGG